MVALLSLTSQAKPLKVFLLVGQSNMQGHAQIRTLEHLMMDPKTVPWHRELVDESGKPRVLDQVWISSLSNDGIRSGKLTAGFGATPDKLGPELAFGFRMQQLLGEPILLIKTSWGGKSLNTDFRSPSAGPYVFQPSQIEQIKKRGQDFDKIRADREAATGHYYRLMLEHVRSVLADPSKVVPGYDRNEGYQIAGFVWFQGWNDMVDASTYPDRGQPGGYAAYSEAMAHFIRDVRKDLGVPQMPFVIGVLGVNGPTNLYGPEQQRYKGIHQGFRDAMAAPVSLPEFQGNVAAVLTENYWDLELSQLRDRDSKLQQQIRKQVSDKKLDKKEQGAALEALRAKSFSARERKIQAKGASNAEFHYMGCAKVLVGIGRGFAEAMAGMMK